MQDNKQRGNAEVRTVQTLCKPCAKYRNFHIFGAGFATFAVFDKLLKCETAQALTSSTLQTWSQIYGNAYIWRVVCKVHRQYLFIAH
jgi:hypothetical protein